jgi:hypothetical protein
LRKPSPMRGRQSSEDQRFRPQGIGPVPATTSSIGKVGKGNK